MIENSTVFNYTMTDSADDDVNDVDVLVEAMSYPMYKIAAGIKTFYLPILIPMGLIGNLLSFLVMMQRHNRSSSLSLYIAVLAVMDSSTLIIGIAAYLNFELKMPQNQYWHCTIGLTAFFTFTLCSSLLIIAMTFERFYSIIRPHKAASFNTVKKARLIIVCIILFSTIYNTPHWFISMRGDEQCVPYGKHSEHILNKVYFWLSAVVHSAMPFTLLLVMNVIIINTIRKRSYMLGRQNAMMGKQGQGEGQGQGQNQGQTEDKGQGQGKATSMKSSEKQIYTTLLLVTFAFITLTTPAYAVILYTLSVNVVESPYTFSGYYLFYHIGEKTYYTNSAINFFLYVISGKKFRRDLMRLFSCFKRKSSGDSSSIEGSSSTNVN